MDNSTCNSMNTVSVDVRIESLPPQTIPKKLCKFTINENFCYEIYYSYVDIIIPRH